MFVRIPVLYPLASTTRVNLQESPSVSLQGHPAAINRAAAGAQVRYLSFLGSLHPWYFQCSVVCGPSFGSPCKAVA
jgi:hypothetical protein